jgi:serine phosphatase RsbU (regulator of sigma subunit)/PAS domain-containing protein
MPRDDRWASESAADLAARRDAIRQAAGIAGADARELLDAALTELDGAIDALAARDVALKAGDGVPGSADPAERRLLHAAFQRAPVPLLMLERDGVIRRANAKAAALIGVPVGYATGKPLTAFMDPSSRAALATQLAAVLRTRESRNVRCRVLTADGPLAATVNADLIELPGDPPLLVVTVLSGADPATPPGTPAPLTVPDVVIRAMTRRMDLVSDVTRLLLDNATFSEAVTLQRCARLLAGELASWVIIDIERDGRLRRQAVTGPAGDLAGIVRNSDPGPETVHAQVHASGQPVLLAHAEDASLLGAGPDGTPLLLALGVTSVACVPVAEGEARYGTMTLIRLAAEAPFSIADLGLAEQLGGHLAVALRVDRMFRRQSQAAEALQASLLPARIPEIPGLELAPAYLGATRSQEVSGDFYDVFRTRDGWAVVIGDVCGKGHDAAAMTAAARHALRALGEAADDPAEVLTRANEVLLAGDWDDRFVTVSLAFLWRRGRDVRVRLGGCGHPGPAVVRADGRVEVIEGGGVPLGLFPGARPGARELELGGGDLLFCYSDGVTDVRDPHGRYFEDRLADELAAMAGRPAAETVRAVQERLSALTGGEFRDDATMLAVRVGPAPSPSPCD